MAASTSRISSVATASAPTANPRAYDNFLRTPDERFANLLGFDYEPHYVENLPHCGPLRMAYIDEGPRVPCETFLCLHGQPSWSYLYRKMIPVFLDSGARVVCPDLFGFGRSDKLVDDDAYSFTFHRNSLLDFVERLDLQNITLVVQDWGGVLGLTLPMEFPERFSRMIVMNTALGLGTGATQGFKDWLAWNKKQYDLPVGKLIRRGTPVLNDEETAAYDAPFPSAEYKAGVRVFPGLVPIEPHMEGVDISRAAAKFFSTVWDKPTFMAIGVADPVLGMPAMKSLRKVIRGCSEPMVVEEGGHFLQEWGEPIARAALDYFDARPRL